MKKKQIFIATLILSLSLGLSACGKKEKEEEKTSASASPNVESEASPSNEVDDETSKSDMKIGLVLAGGLGDRSFYDSSHEGVVKAEEELGAEYQVFECKNDASLLSDQLVQASEYGNIVAIVGHEFSDVAKTVSVEFPDVNYIYVDTDIEGIDNLTSVSYAENEGGFLAGALAAMMTTDTSVEGINDKKIIGMVGGLDIPVIRNFYVGYEQGAKYIDPTMEVSVLYAGDFEDPAKGKESATVLYGGDADIVFQAAGKSGEGVFEAAKEQGKYAIGVDTDQRYINPDNIVASMVKEVGLSIFDVIEKIEAGEIEKGKMVSCGLAEERIGIGYGTDDMPQLVNDEIKAKVEELKGKIISGEIKVETAKDGEEES